MEVAGVWVNPGVFCWKKKEVSSGTDEICAGANSSIDRVGLMSPGTVWVWEHRDYLQCGAPLVCSGMRVYAIYMSPLHWPHNALAPEEKVVSSLLPPSLPHSMEPVSAYHTQCLSFPFLPPACFYSAAGFPKAAGPGGIRGSWDGGKGSVEKKWGFSSKEAEDDWTSGGSGDSETSWSCKAVKEAIGDIVEKLGLFQCGCRG